VGRPCVGTLSLADYYYQHQLDWEISIAFMSWLHPLWSNTAALLLQPHIPAKRTCSRMLPQSPFNHQSAVVAVIVTVEFPQRHRSDVGLEPILIFDLLAKLLVWCVSQK